MASINSDKEKKNISVSTNRRNLGYSLNDNLTESSSALLVMALLQLVSAVFIFSSHTIASLYNLHNMDIVNNIIAPLLVAIITGTSGWILATYRQRKKYMKKIEAAPQQYVLELDYLIQKGIQEGEQNAIINARAIVATRNSLRSSLVSLSKNLNSEIDRLAEEIGEVNEVPLGPSKPEKGRAIDSKAAFETILVLSKIWPAKKSQIEVELRKLLAELGLDSNMFSKL